MDILARLPFLAIIIAFTRRHYKTSRDATTTSFACPECEKKGLRVLEQQGYLCLFFKWLPIFPIGRKEIISCLACSWSQDAKDLKSESLRALIEPLRNRTAILWRFPFGLILILTICASDYASHHYRVSTALKYLEAPQAGYVLLFSPRESYSISDEKITFYFFSKYDYQFAYIEAVANDELSVRISNRTFGNDIAAHFNSGKYKDESNFFGEDGLYNQHTFVLNKNSLKEAWEVIGVFQVTPQISKNQ